MIQAIAIDWRMVAALGAVGLMLALFLVIVAIALAGAGLLAGERFVCTCNACNCDRPAMVAGGACRGCKGHFDEVA